MCPLTYKSPQWSCQLHRYQHHYPHFTERNPGVEGNEMGLENSVSFQITVEDILGGEIFMEGGILFF